MRPAVRGFLLPGAIISTHAQRLADRIRHLDTVRKLCRRPRDGRLLLTSFPLLVPTTGGFLLTVVGASGQRPQQQQDQRCWQ